MPLLPLVLACWCANPQPDDSPDESPADSPDDSPGDDSPDDSPGDDSADDTGDGPVDVGPAFHFARGRPRNVILISLDTLRYDRINAHGYADRVTTPTIDRLLSEGVVLQSHFSCSSWTYPSALCALSGQDQVSLGTWPDNSTDQTPPPAADELTLLAERFAEAGYYTMLAGASAFFGESANMAQGYEAGRSRFMDGDAWIDAEDLADEVRELVGNRDATRPFLLHVHFLDPHMPYDPPAAYLTELDSLNPTAYDLNTEAGTLALWRAFPNLSELARSVNQQHLAVRYDGAIRYADDTIDAMLQRFDELGLWEDTVLLFFTDHGEEFYEHGNFNHGYTAYDEITRSTAIFWQPGNLSPAAVSDFTSHEDLLPTLAAIVDLPADPAWTGKIVGIESQDRVLNLSYRQERTVQSVRESQYKLIYRWDGQRELYDLDADPGETQNLYDPESATVQALWATLLPEVERLAAVESGASPVLPGP